jgi:hypothetical protein
MSLVKDNEVVAIGSTAWNDQVEAESPEGTVVIRTMSGVAARRFRPDQLRIDPNVADCDNFERIRIWTTTTIGVRFGPDDYVEAHAMLDAHGLLIRPPISRSYPTEGI